MTTETSAPPAPARRTTDTHLTVASLFPSPNNPRHIDPEDPTLVELAESMKSLGLLQPLVVRDADPSIPSHETSAVKYEVLAGHRRLAAAKLAGLAELPCRIIEDCDNRTALEITVVENLQRQDLKPLEEAHGVAALLDGGWDVADIAAHLGKSERWVYLRAKLRDLSPAWRKALADRKSDAGKMSAGALELIARHREEDQDWVLNEYFGKSTWDDEHEEALRRTVSEWQTYLSERFLRDLKQAKWDLHDGELVPAAGACSVCPKRSSCQQELFETKGGDRCLDGSCWQGKQAAWIAKREAELKAKHPEIQRATTEWSRSEEEKLPRISEYGGDLKPAKKTSPKAVPVIPVDGKQAGQVVWVEPAKTSQGTSAKATVAKAKPDGKAARAEARARWLGMRAKASIRHIEAWLSEQGDGADPASVPKRDPRHLVLLLCMAFERLSSVGSTRDFDLEYLQTLEGMGPEVLSGRIWGMVAESWARSLPSPSVGLDGHAQAWPATATLLRHIGLDAIVDKIEDTVRAEVPIPKKLMPFFDERGEPIPDAPTDAKPKDKGKVKAKAKTAPKTTEKPAAKSKEKATTKIIRKAKAPVKPKATKGKA